MRNDNPRRRPAAGPGGFFFPADAISHKINPKSRSAIAVLGTLLLIGIGLPAVAEPAPAPLATECVQVFPHRGPDVAWARSPNQTRAVLLLHGLHPHAFSDAVVYRPVRSSWQEPGSTLVQTLGHDADVYSYSYAQNVPVETIAASPDLLSVVGRLRQLGYLEIVMLGHSAGGVIARRFVEDHPDAGVTKVIQVCAPNAGSSLGKVSATVRHSQEPFLASLTKQARQADLKTRAGLRVPAHVEFVCVVGSLFGCSGDGAVRCDCQWPDDLQAQGIPAVRFGAGHVAAVRSTKAAELLAELVRAPQPRWTAEQVRQARFQVLKE